MEIPTNNLREKTMTDISSNDPSQSPGAPGADPEPGFSEPVWTFRGYSLKASEFTTAMVHLFRAEIQRANVWRQRLDTSTNWAILTTGAAISIGFGQTGGFHGVILINLILVTFFLVIEARRYRYYELWSYRVRLMETDFYAAMLVPPFHPSSEWAEALAESLLHPDFPISYIEAFGRRLRRNYYYIYAIIGAAWLVKLWLFPNPATDLFTFIQRAEIGGLGGPFILAIVVLFYAALIAIGITTAGLQQAPGEVLPRYGDLSEVPTSGEGETAKTETRAWFRPVRRRKQLLTLIITDRPVEVSKRILTEMLRGVTSLSGTGMFTGKEHQVLLCAMTVTEIPQLKELVKTEDPNAFVIVSPAQEIFGRGFQTLQEQKS
jgi:uncharacterized membrane protein